jgi:formiminotetrahydrofolate cyclodeaminase
MQGVGALALHACIRGAFLNVKVNLPGLDDEEFTAKLTSSAGEIIGRSLAEEQEILKTVAGKLQ